MSAIPELSMKQIRAWVDGASLERGMRYFNDGSISDGRREGLTLKALCEGSQGGPYRVSGTPEAGRRDRQRRLLLPGGRRRPLQARRRAAAHLAGTPRSFPGDRVARRDAVRHDPRAAYRGDQADDPGAAGPGVRARAPLPVPGGRDVVKPETFRRRAKGVFDRAGDEWGVESEIASALEAVIEIGDDFAEAGEPANAAAVYEGVAAELLDRLGNHQYEDEAGDLLAVVGRSAEKAAALLPKLTDPPARERVLRFIFDLYRYDIDAGGVDALGDASEAFVSRTTPDERRTVAEWARAELKGKNGWAAEAIGSLLLDLEGDTLDDEAFLRVCRDTGRRDDLIERLLKLGRVDEAITELRGATSSYEVARLADLFVPYRHGDVAEGVVLDRLRHKPDPSNVNGSYDRVALLEWLKRRASARSDPAEVLSLATRIFEIRPSREGYDEIRKLATKNRTWEATRPALLAQLDKLGSGYRDLLIRIHLDEGRLDEALGLVRPPGRRTPITSWGFHAFSSIELDVAKAAEKVRPEAAIEIYTRRAEALVGAGSREHYRGACDFMKKVRALYRDCGAPDKWERYVTSVREKHPRLRALKEEMDKAAHLTSPLAHAYRKRRVRSGVDWHAVPAAV